MPANITGTKELLINIIGKDAALILMQSKQFAGCSIDFPCQSKGTSKVVPLLISVIGIEASDKLIAHFRGDRIYIPKDDLQIRNKRNRSIVEAYSNGLSISKLTADFNLSDRHIRNILKKTEMTEQL